MVSDPSVFADIGNQAVGQNLTLALLLSFVRRDHTTPGYGDGDACHCMTRTGKLKRLLIFCLDHLDGL